MLDESLYEGMASINKCVRAVQSGLWRSQVADIVAANFKCHVILLVPRVTFFPRAFRLSESRNCKLHLQVGTLVRRRPVLRVSV